MGRWLVACAFACLSSTPALAQPSAEVELQPVGPSPRGAFIRSLVVPGWGQMYNGRWIKGTLFAAGQVTLAVRGVQAQRDANDFDDMADALESSSEQRSILRARNRALDRRDDFIWWSVFALLFSGIDAYVDAALWEIGPEFEDVAPYDDESVVRFGISRSFR